ncbi:MAG: hypothetical protein JJ979_27930, partial [Roseibium sp.]|nr:hypothetical protein [Roseibium sp.]
MAIVSKAVPVPELVPVKRALLSVFDKTGLVDFAKALADRGVELVSTGGSYKALKDAGLAVLDISEVTGLYVSGVVGNLRTVCIQCPGNQEINKFEGNLEIVSLNGHFNKGD